eukprot:1191979-Prorocentrum_minimum.AAC.1
MTIFQDSRCWFIRWLCNGVFYTKRISVWGVECVLAKWVGLVASTGIQATVPAASGAQVVVCVATAAGDCLCPVGSHYGAFGPGGSAACAPCAVNKYGLDGLTCNECPLGAVCGGGASFEAPRHDTILH